MIVHSVFCFALLFECVLQGNVVDRRVVQQVNCRLVSGCLTGLGAGFWLWLGHGVWDGAWDVFRGCTWTQGWDRVWDGQASAMGATKLASWCTTVHRCSILGEGRWCFGRKGVFVGAYWFCGGPFR